MQEVLHRIIVVQRLIFTDEANKISFAVDKVNAANTTLQKDLSDIKGITDLVKTVTAFLTLVDTAIDLAKTLM